MLYNEKCKILHEMRCSRLLLLKQMQIAMQLHFDLTGISEQKVDSEARVSHGT